MLGNFFAGADCGSNSFHLIVVRTEKNKIVEVIAREREIIRLSYPDKNIPAHLIEKAGQTLTKFRTIADSYNAPLQVVATSAVRESLNKDAFLSAIKNKTGISIRVLTGDQEAALTFLGVSGAFRTNQTILCIDIGGGSTEFIIGRQGQILFSRSLELGALRLTRKFFNEDFSFTNEQVGNCYKYTSSLINGYTSEIKLYNYQNVIGASGTIISAASVISSGKPDLHGFTLKKADLKQISDLILRTPDVEERKKIAGLEPLRADIMPAGMIILSCIFDTLHLEEMIVSTSGLREGVIINAFLKTPSL